MGAAGKKSLETMVQEARARANASLACLVVSREYGLKPDEVLHAATPAERDAQKIAIYLTVVELRSSQIKAAAAFDCGKTKINYAVQAIELRRESDLDFETVISRLTLYACPLTGGAPRRYL